MADASGSPVGQVKKEDTISRKADASLHELFHQEIVTNIIELYKHIFQLFSEPNAAVNEIVPNMGQLIEDLPMEEQAYDVVIENSEAVESEQGHLHYISGDKPFFDVILGKSHVKPIYNFQLPAKIVRELPQATIPAVLRCGCKNWNLDYVWTSKYSRFDPRWKHFVNDNDLEEGDACVFELLECSKEIIKFKVIILKNSLPAELVETVHSQGSSDDPILVE